MKVRIAKAAALWVGILAGQSVDALELNIDDANSVKQAASTVAAGMVQFYTGGVDGQVISQMPGLLPGPYYWWEAGAMMGSLIDYWYYTGDNKYNKMVMEGMLFQVGDNENYEPMNQTKSLGNDDQAFWGLAAMSAAEAAFPNPSNDKPQWLALAQAVFNSQALRWDTSACGGGLKWQIFPFNQGYDYRNSISNGCFFNLAARLGAYTHNETYFKWADKMYDWVADPTISLISDQYMIYDGTTDTNNCSDQNRVQWSYNAGVFLLGAATMWNQTEGAAQDEWAVRIQGILDATSRIFFRDGIMTESACEPRGNCNIDQRSFKAYLARWMAATTKVAPWTHDQIVPMIESSAQAAATSCSGGDDGNTCGMRWTTGNWDGSTGVGEQMCALEVIQSVLIDQVPGPVANGSGGISEGDPTAGTGGDENIFYSPITTADRAGAWIITFLVLLLFIGGTWWLVA